MNVRYFQQITHQMKDVMNRDLGLITDGGLVIASSDNCITNADLECVLSFTEDNIDTFIFPTCCHVIPGDDVLGYIDNKKRIEIHKRDCHVANRLKASFGNRILDAKWNMHKRCCFDATIEIHGIDRKGMLLDVSKVITNQLDINIHKVTISTQNGIFDGPIELRVHDRDEVKVIIESLKKNEGLKEIQRIL